MEDNTNQNSLQTSLSTAPKQLIKKNNLLKLILKIIIHLLVLVGIGYLIFQYFQLKRQSAEIQANASKKIVAILDYDGIHTDVENEINKVLSGKIEFNNKKDTVPYYLSEFNLSKSGQTGLTFSVEVFKYFSGAKYNDGYEAMEWTVNLDNIVTKLNKLKLGSQITFPIDESQLFGKSKTEVKYKQLGNQKWAIYESSFFMSRTDTREYWSFNPNTNLITHIALSMRDLNIKRQGMVECYRKINKEIDSECIVSYFYTDELQTVINDIEYLLKKGYLKI
ncbi:MAG: hypothetical protein ABIJ05_05525 [Patescibacteria group bacterium]